MINSKCLLHLSICCAVLLLAPAAATAAHFSIGQNFSDTFFSQSGFIPPDTMGAVGPSDVAVLINGRFAVYNRTGVQQTAKSLDQFWIDAGVTPAGSFSFDPRIIYDDHSGRWFATSVDNGGSANNFLVAVSSTNDPKGTWTGFAIDSDPNDVRWADFPMMGLNQDVLTISANMFAIGAGSSNTGFLVIPKSDLTQPVPTIANMTQFIDVNPNGTGFSAQPILDYDNGNLPLPILSAFNKPAGFLKTSSIGGTANAPRSTRSEVSLVLLHAALHLTSISLDRKPILMPVTTGSAAMLSCNKSPVVPILASGASKV